MKINTVIGKDTKKVTIKEYPSGMKIVTEGDSDTVETWTSNKPKKVHVLEVDERQKGELLNKPDNFKINKGKLVRKGKKK